MARGSRSARRRAEKTRNYNVLCVPVPACVQASPERVREDRLVLASVETGRALRRLGGSLSVLRSFLLVARRLGVILLNTHIV